MKKALKTAFIIYIVICFINLTFRTDTSIAVWNIFKYLLMPLC